MKVVINDDFSFSECVQLSDSKIKLLLSIRFGKYEEEDLSVELVKNSKVGKIRIKKISKNPGYLNKKRLVFWNYRQFWRRYGSIYF